MRRTQPIYPSHLVLHPDWERYLRSLQAAGLMYEVDVDALGEDLGPIAILPPEAATKATLLDGYYSGEGDLDVGLRRITIDRYVAHHTTDPWQAQDFVARLYLAIRELGPLTLIEDPAGSGDLMLRTTLVSARIAQPAVLRRSMALVDPIHGNRLLPVRSIVAAANELLLRRRFTMRLVPLEIGPNAEAFVALERPDAMILEYGDVLERPLNEMNDFLRWDPSDVLAVRGRDVA